MARDTLTMLNVKGERVLFSLRDAFALPTDKAVAAMTAARLRGDIDQQLYEICIRAIQHAKSAQQAKQAVP